MYNTTASGRAAVAAVRQDGGASEDLNQTSPNLLSGAATSDGGTLVFAIRNDGLWKTDGSGLSAVQLTPYAAFDVRVTPDDRHVVFLSPQNGVESPWIVPLSGGPAREIINESAHWGSVDVSPDSRRLVFVFRDTLNVCDLPACANRLKLSVPANFGRRPRWTPDGRQIAYIDVIETNLWSMPVEGGPPKPLTRFTDRTPGRKIDAFDWSRDGQRLAIIRATSTNDIVLFRGLQP
jgi:Tol biopolymer transport system component